MLTIILTLCMVVITVQCNEIKNQIYYEIPNESISHCVRRLNYTSSIGCSSESKGNVGIIEIAFNKTDLNDKLKYLKENTILVISTSLFIKPNLTNLILRNKFIKGLVVFERNNCSGLACINTRESFSEDYPIPNEAFSLFNNHSYNPAGTKYAFRNWPFPVSLIDSRHKIEQNQTNLKKSVLFLFLDNESYDYLGSDRFAWELNNNYLVNFTGVPVDFTNIDLLLEFGEMGFTNFSQTSFFYPQIPGQDKINNKTLNYFNKLWKSFERFGFSNSYTNHNMPPASIQYFLRNKSIPSIVMSDHMESFKNMFYNSYLDSKFSHDISTELLAIVNSVASFVYQEATGNNLAQLMNVSNDANPFSIIDCFTNNIRCDLLKKVLPTTLIETLYHLGTPIPTQEHSSKSKKYLRYRFSSLLEHLITFFSGQKVNNTECTSCPKCKNLTKLDHGNTSDCYLINYYISDNFYNTEKNAPLWSMSAIVDDQSIKMFVQGPNTPLLVTGILITMVMIIFMILISSRMSEIFQSDS